MKGKCDMIIYLVHNLRLLHPSSYAQLFAILLLFSKVPKAEKSLTTLEYNIEKERKLKTQVEALAVVMCYVLNKAPRLLL